MFCVISNSQQKMKRFISGLPNYSKSLRKFSSVIENLESSPNGIEIKKDYNSNYYIRNKAAIRERKRLYYLRNKDSIGDSNREKYVGDSNLKDYGVRRKESRSQYVRNYGMRNKLSRSQYLRDYYIRNKDIISELKRDNYTRNKRNFREYRRQHYIRSKEFPELYSPRDITIKSWKTPELVRDFFDAIGKKLSISNYTDWYRVSRPQILYLGGMCCFFGD
jgi:hypothetical protein